MERNNSGWFSSKNDSDGIGFDYESKSVKNHKYYVKVKSNHLLNKAKKIFKDNRGLVCVDLGCGTAETTEYFQGKFKHIYACDYSYGMLKYAAKKNLKNVTFNLCRSEDLPFKDGSADIVVMYGLIHHIEDGEKISKTFKEIKRILKKRGIIAVYDFNPFNPVSRHIVKTCPIDVGVYLDGYRNSLFPTTYYSWELINIVKNAGFSTVKCEYLIFFPKILSMFVFLEEIFKKLPFGGMYSIIGIK